MSKAEWYIARDDERQGPLTAAQMRALANRGDLTPDDQVWKEGLDTWVPASRIKKLFDNVHRSAAPPPLPPSSPAANPFAIQSARPSAKSRARRVNGDTEQGSGFHAQRIGILISSSLGALATFLPWAHAPFIGSIYGTTGDGWFTFAFFLVGILFSLTGSYSQPVRGWRRIVTSFFAVLALLIAVQKVVSFNSGALADPSNPFSEALTKSIQLGIGIYLVIGAGAAVCITAWTLSRQR